MEILTFNNDLRPKIRKVKLSFLYYCLKLPMDLYVIINKFITTYKDLKEYSVLYEIKVIIQQNKLNINECVNPSINWEILEKYIIPSDQVNFSTDRCKLIASYGVNHMYAQYMISSCINKFRYYDNNKNANLYILNQPFMCNPQTGTDLLSHLISKYYHSFTTL